jgi:hypothetical protein
MKKYTYPFLIAIMIVSCSTPKLAVPEKFMAVSDKMPIKGVNNWIFNQKLSFGKYQTTKVKRGWTSTTERNHYTIEQRLMKVFNLDNFTSISQQKNKYRYTIQDGINEAQIFCLEKMNREELKIKTHTRLLGDISRTQNYQYSFSAGILPMKDTAAEPWQLLVYNTYERAKDTARRLFDLPYVEEEGYATNGTETITIKPVRVANMTARNGRQAQYPVKILSGYELRIDDGVIAIIDSLSNQLWIYKELDEPTRLIVASISSALLLRKLEGTSGM